MAERRRQPDRRTSPPDEAGYRGPERRENAHRYDPERFEYIQSWIVLMLAVIVVLSILVAAILTELGDAGVIIALIGFAGSVLVIPYAQKLDRIRARRRNGEET